VGNRRILITGAGGFVGRHLVRLLATDPDVTIFGTVHRSRPVADAGVPDSITLLQGDLLDQPFVERSVQEAAPTWVVHLAAQSSVAESWRDPAGTLKTNVVGQVNLLEAVLHRAPQARILVVGSSEEYGRIRPEDLPADEDTELRPENPYGASKVAQDFLGLQYHLGRGLDVVRARPFPLFGPGQSDHFATASFARQIAEAEAGRREPVLLVGNLAARRDYTDVRDAVLAYRALLERGQAGQVYNVGGGGVHHIGEILDALLQRARRAVEVRVDPARFRPGEAPEVAGDVSRICRETGWAPERPFEQTVQEILNDWRTRISAPTIDSTQPTP
jgi:GDP-4-dehydro-6-deoxy-D-mannose reductase